MFRKDRDLMEVFNDRWKANHNKHLEKIIEKNKTGILERSYGIENDMNKRSILKKDKPIGYNNMNSRRP